MLLQLFHFSPPLYSPQPFTTTSQQHSPTLVHVRGSCMCKFFGFSISYTILNLPLSIFYYHLCYLFSVPFPPLSPLTPSLITLHVMSISVILFLF